MIWILLLKKLDVSIDQAFCWNPAQIVVEFVRVGKAHNTSSLIVSTAESIKREEIDYFLNIWRRSSIEQKNASSMHTLKYNPIDLKRGNS